MEIPMDRRIAELYSKGIPIVDELPDYRKEFLALFEKIKNLSKRSMEKKEVRDVVRREFL